MIEISEKTLAIRVDEDFYKKVKLRLAENGMTLKNYFIALVEKDIEESTPDSSENYTKQELCDKADEVIRLLQEFMAKEK